MITCPQCRSALSQSSFEQSFRSSTVKVSGKMANWKDRNSTPDPLPLWQLWLEEHQLFLSLSQQILFLRWWVLGRILRSIITILHPLATLKTQFTWRRLTAKFQAATTWVDRGEDLQTSPPDSDCSQHPQQLPHTSLPSNKRAIGFSSYPG